MIIDMAEFMKFMTNDIKKWTLRIIFALILSATMAASFLILASCVIGDCERLIL